jgi:FkbM family methyltransferase
MISYLKQIARTTSAGSALRRMRIIRSLRAWNDRDQSAARFYSQFVGPKDTVFDVGANYGNRIKIFRVLGSRVVAVEPQNTCFKTLQAVYASDPKVTLIQAACGLSIGAATLKIATADTLSSLSQDWISAVIASGRFGEHRWERTQPCSVTTLDELIVSNGTPAFIKVDVEGFELEVLKGLSQVVPCVSFEFTPETLDRTVECIEHLASLGFSQFNLSVGESMYLEREAWFTRETLLLRMEEYRGDTLNFGDVYARASITL